MKAIVGLLAVSMLVAACATQTADRRAEGQALVADSTAVRCDEVGRRAVSPDGTAGDSPFSGSSWTTARSWENATASSRAQIDRDIANMVSRDCLRSAR